MSNKNPSNTYSVLEERLNALSHFIGLCLAVLGFTLLIDKSSGITELIAASVFGSSLVLLFAASTLYHWVQDAKWKLIFKRADHIAIYLLIAGSYTPFLLVALDGWISVASMIAIWCIAVLGILFKTLFKNRFPRLAVAIYAVMGWLALLIIVPIFNAVPMMGFMLLFLGGLAYTFGIPFYIAKHKQFTHAIWHCFVLLGAICHFFAIYSYVIGMDTSVEAGTSKLANTTMSVQLSSTINTTDSTAPLLQLTLENIATKIDQRISSLKMLANTIANDTHIQAWVTQDFTPQHEILLVDKLGYLVHEYGLTSASFADIDSHQYWNHEGFLRVLDPNIDTWYFAFINTGKQDLISVYHDKNKHRVDLYVNYRQPNGRGLSGIATSFDGVVDMLAQSPLSQLGEVFIVDAQGVIQVHPDPLIAGQDSLQQRYSTDTAAQLLTKQAFNHTHDNVYLASSYIASMDWFVVTQLNAQPSSNVTANSH